MPNLFKINPIVEFNKKRGVRISWQSKYNSLTKRYDLPEWVFISGKHIIAKVSKHDKKYPNEIVFVKEIHSGCMGDHATVIRRNGAEVIVDECGLGKPSLKETLIFMLMPVHRTIIKEFSCE